MSIKGTCKKCGNETVDYACLVCTEDELREAKERIAELEAKIVRLEGNAALDEVRLDAVKAMTGPCATHVKVSEVSGYYIGTYEDGYVICTKGDPREDWAPGKIVETVGLDEFVPREVMQGEDHPCSGNEGRRGRFRVTVEFWPEEAKNGQ